MTTTEQKSQMDVETKQNDVETPKQKLQKLMKKKDKLEKEITSIMQLIPKEFRNVFSISICV